jgi:hypothetical protein
MAAGAAFSMLVIWGCCATAKPATDRKMAPAIIIRLLARRRVVKNTPIPARLTLQVALLNH